MPDNARQSSLPFNMLLSSGQKQKENIPATAYDNLKCWENLMQFTHNPSK